MSEEQTIREDYRAIQCLYYPEGHNAATVGCNGITRIVAYEEPGQMAPVPWFAVWAEDVLQYRVNAAHVAQVGYVP